MHFIDDDDIRHPDFEEFFPSESSAALPSLIATVDRAAILCPSLRRWMGNDSIVCFAGDAERLRMEHYRITADSLLDVFGQSVQVTHLTLSLAVSDSLNVDFRAFPHLVHLVVAGPSLDTMARTLGPTDKPRGRAAQRAAPPVLCLSLAELVVTFGLVVQTIASATPKPKGRAASGSGSSQAGHGTNVDQVFGEKCSVLRQVLAVRASSGSRLTSLALRAFPASILVQPSRISASGGSADPNPVWPSPAARQSVLASLQELVDGPVILKLLNQAGGKVSVDEDEA